jgi:hypothetical protein
LGYYAVFGLAFGIIGLDIFLRLVLIEKKDALKWLHTGKCSTEPVDNPMEKQPTDGREPLPLPTDECDSNSRIEHDAASDPTPLGNAIGVNQQMPRKRRFGAVTTLLTSDRMLVTLWAYFIVAAALTSLDSVLPLFVQDTFGWKRQVPPGSPLCSWWSIAHHSPIVRASPTCRNEFYESKSGALCAVSSDRALPGLPDSTALC